MSDTEYTLMLIGVFLAAVAAIRCASWLLGRTTDRRRSKDGPANVSGAARR